MFSRSSDNAKEFVNGFGRVLDKLAAEEWTVEKIADKEVDDFLKYKEVANSWKQFSELTLGICEQMDEQSRMLEDLQENMKKLLKNEK